jgi:hypothetical protein
MERLPLPWAPSEDWIMEKMDAGTVLNRGLIRQRGAIRLKVPTQLLHSQKWCKIIKENQ